MRFQILRLLVLACISCSSPPKKSPSADISLVPQRDYLHTFGWSAFYFKRDKEKLNPRNVSFYLIGNVEFQISDTAVWIMPLDTTRILIEIDGAQNMQTYTLRAKANPLIDSSWYNLPLGQLPTPLDQNSMKAWRNFSQFRLFGKQVPDFQHYDYLTSDTLTSDIFTGKTTLLNFWYRGCLPCMAEMPALKKLKGEWEHNDHIQFISVCLDSVYVKNDSVFVPSNRITRIETSPDFNVETGFRHIGLGKSIADSLKVIAYPTNLIIDLNGVVRKVLTGAKIEDSNDVLALNLSREISRIHNSQKLKQETILKPTLPVD